MTQADSASIVGLYQSQRIPTLGNTKYFLKGLQWFAQTFVYRDHYCFEQQTNLPSALRRSSFSASQVCFLYILKRESETKAFNVFVQQMCRNAENQLRILSQQSYQFVISFVLEFKSFLKFRIRLTVCILGDKQPSESV